MISGVDLRNQPTHNLLSVALFFPLGKTFFKCYPLTKR